MNSRNSSMLGRILTHLKRRGRLVEPPRSGLPGSRRALWPRPYAVRKPKQWVVFQPGDLVQVNTWTRVLCLGWSLSSSPPAT